MNIKNILNFIINNNLNYLKKFKQIFIKLNTITEKNINKSIKIINFIFIINLKF